MDVCLCSTQIIFVHTKEDSIADRRRAARALLWTGTCDRHDARHRCSVPLTGTCRCIRVQSMDRADLYLAATALRTRIPSASKSDDSGQWMICPFSVNPSAELSSLPSWTHLLALLILNIVFRSPRVESHGRRSGPGHYYADRFHTEIQEAGRMPGPQHSEGG